MTYCYIPADGITVKLINANENQIMNNNLYEPARMGTSRLFYFSRLYTEIFDVCQKKHTNSIYFKKRK